MATANICGYPWKIVAYRCVCPRPRWPKIPPDASIFLAVTSRNQERLRNYPLSKDHEQAVVVVCFFRARSYSPFLSILIAFDSVFRAPIFSLPRQRAHLSHNFCLLPFWVNATKTAAFPTKVRDFVKYVNRGL